MGSTDQIAQIAQKPSAQEVKPLPRDDSSGGIKRVMVSPLSRRGVTIHGSYPFDSRQALSPARKNGSVLPSVRRCPADSKQLTIPEMHHPNKPLTSDQHRARGTPA